MTFEYIPKKAVEKISNNDFYRNQPCLSFKGDGESHQCPKCGGIRKFCLNCNADHHVGGWLKCDILKEVVEIKEEDIYRLLLLNTDCWTTTKRIYELFQGDK